jgi:hypothetical protein
MEFQNPIEAGFNAGFNRSRTESAPSGCTPLHIEKEI